MRSDEEELTWKWRYEGNDMFMDVDEEARALVHSSAAVAMQAPLSCML
jgi:hypothetical protein